jgi:dTDP-4-dehydrorhamnose reductase
MTPIPVLVTGANGQLGCELRALEASYPQFLFHFYDREGLPLDRTDLLSEAFETIRPQICINAAAYTAVDRAEAEPELAYAINGKAVGDLAALCHLRGTLLVHVSTDYVFDGQGKEPYRESDPVHPLGVYGASKLQGEKLAFETHNRVVIVRTSWVYSSFGKNFVKTMLRLMSDKESISVVNDQVGTPTYAADLAAALLDVAATYIRLPETEGQTDPRFNRLYHFADRGAISWFEFAGAIREMISSPCEVRPISTAEYPTAARRPAYSVLDTRGIEDAFGLHIPDWKSSLHRCLERIRS